MRFVSAMVAIMSVHAHMPASCTNTADLSVRSVVSRVMNCVGADGKFNDDEFVKCASQELGVLNSASEPCMTCLEHFLEDHFTEVARECWSNYLSTGEGRQECVHMVTSAILKDCF